MVQIECSQSDALRSRDCRLPENVENACFVRYLDKTPEIGRSLRERDTVGLNLADLLHVTATVLAQKPCGDMKNLRRKLELRGIQHAYIEYPSIMEEAVDNAVVAVGRVVYKTDQAPDGLEVTLFISERINEDACTGKEVPAPGFGLMVRVRDASVKGIKPRKGEIALEYVNKLVVKDFFRKDRK